MAKSSWNFDDSFLCQLTHDWKDFMEELVSPSRARWTHGVINSVEDMEAVISSAVNHLIPCELSIRQNGGCIRAYHFLRSTLAHDSRSECKEKTGSSMQRIFEVSSVPSGRFYAGRPASLIRCLPNSIRLFLPTIWKERRMTI
ncbi:unnamed protein product [Calicophoron daubneyi]|uniref:Uncharacterized protein n=1 Tax=Calicophoron daubneyi TaxID=300641 RepID=A0AAV2TQ57_CALDB